MQNNDFFIEKQKAVERMKEMQNRSGNYGNMPPMPSFVSTDRNAAHQKRRQQKTEYKNGSLFSGDLLSSLELPFLSSKDPDISLLLGLFLLLSSEGGDRLLLYAVLYILL